MLGRLRPFLTQNIPHFTRVLLVESGSRAIFDNVLPGLVELYGDKFKPDLLTCFQGAPQGFPEGRRAYRVYEYPDAAARNKLLEELQATQYLIVVILCSGESIMTKWKWWLAAHLRAKVCILNENGDYFYLDYSNWRTVLHFLAFRAHLTGADAVTTITRLMMLPFTVTYLLAFAAVVHLRRHARMRGT